MPLLNLPNELLLTIADNLEPRDLNLFIQTNRHLAQLLTPYIRRLSGRLPYELGALFWAASSGNTAVAKILLTEARDITVEQIVDETVIFYREPGQPPEQYLRFVYEDGQFFFYDLDVEGKGFHWAVRNSHYSLARLMLDEQKCGVEVDKEIIYDIAVDARPETPLPYVCANGDTQMVELLISKGASVTAKDPHRNGRNPLHVATIAGQIEVVKLLLKHGADPNSRDTRGRKAIDYAEKNGHDDIARVLIENVDPGFKDFCERPLMHLAIKYSHDDLARRLIERGECYFSTDHNGMNALHYCAKMGNVEIAKLIVKAGIYVCVEELQGRSPLHLAAQHGQAQFISAMMDLGARVNSKDKWGRNPLHVAARHDEESVKVMLEKLDPQTLSEVVHSTDDCGRSAMHMAAQYSRPAAMEALIKKGAIGFFEKDNFGRTPMYWIEKEKAGRGENSCFLALDV